MSSIVSILSCTCISPYHRYSFNPILYLYFLHISSIVSILSCTFISPYLWYTFYPILYLYFLHISSIVTILSCTFISPYLWYSFKPILYLYFLHISSLVCKLYPENDLSFNMISCFNILRKYENLLCSVSPPPSPLHTYYIWMVHLLSIKRNLRNEHNSFHIIFHSYFCRISILKTQIVENVFMLF